MKRHLNKIRETNGGKIEEQDIYPIDLRFCTGTFGKWHFGVLVNFIISKLKFCKIAQLILLD
jgi:hypothetical protein